MKTQTIKIPLLGFAVLASSVCLHAGTIVKANNTDNLNLTTSWTNGVVPGAGDVATWSSIVSGANSTALGADTSWGGILVTNPGGPVTITGANTLTTGTNGIDMRGATQNLTIGSGFILGPGEQFWRVTNGINLAVSGAFTRAAGAALITGSPAVTNTSQGTVTLSPTLENGVLPWATVQGSGTVSNGTANGNAFATVTGGNIVAYTSATPETTAGTSAVFGGIPAGDDSTFNYDLAVASTGGSMTNDVYVNTLRVTAGAYTQNGTANFRANAIMNSGTGLLTIGTPLQQADTTLNELVLAPWTQGITFNGVLSDNVNPLHVTVAGTNGQNIIFSQLNTYSGGITIDGGRVGVIISSVPTTGVVTSGPLGTGPITLNGGTLYAGSGGWIVANPIIVGPAGGFLQYATASPDLTINGNVTGSGTLVMAGVFNVNGLFLNGDDSAFTGTVIVTGANNRLGTSLSGSSLAKWVINGALSAQFVGGTNYYLGELSSTVTTGSLNGHAGNLAPAIQNFVVGALNTSSTFSGLLVNNSANNAQTGNSDAAANNLVGLTKVGSGTLTLTGANTATGPIVVSAGALQLGTNGTTGKLAPGQTIQDDARFIISRNNAAVQGTDFSTAPITGAGSFTQAGTGTTTFTATNTYAGDTLVSAGGLIVNGGIAGSATVASGAKLSGSGTIGGVVTVQSGGTIEGGNTNIGNLTLNATPVLGGTVIVRVNASTAQADQITVTGGNPVNYGGTLVVSNTGGSLLAGDAFMIVNAASHNGSFSSVVGSPGAGLAYSFANGLLSVVSTIPSDSPPISTTVSGPINARTLAIAWPTNHLGWVLQSQSNNIDASINTNASAWLDVPGSASVTSLTFPNLNLSKAVYYRLRLVGSPIPSGPPTALTAKSTNSQVTLTWTGSTFARSYNVKSSFTSGGPYSLIANVITTGYTNTGLINNTTYFYVVSAMNQNGESADSAEVNATPTAVPPVAPTGLTTLAAHGQVQVSWNSAIGAMSYNLKRSTTSGGPYTTLTNTAATSVLDTSGLVDGTTYYYVVSGVNIDGESPNSAEASATPTAVPPAVPIGLTAVGEYTQVKLNWTPSFGAATYNLKVSTTSGGPYTLYTNTTTTNVYDTGLINGTQYYFVVSSLNSIGESANSAEATATPSSVLPLFYDFENTGTGYPAPPLPALGSPNLPFIQPLPDPYYYGNDPLNISGTGSTNFSDWEHHRSEVFAQIQNYEIGLKPVVPPSMISASVSGTGTSRTLTVIVTNIVSGTNRTLTIVVPIGLPASSGTFPAIIGMNSSSGSVNTSLLTAVAKVTYNVNQVSVYGTQGATDPYYLLYAAPSVPALDVFNTGQYSAWSWGLSRIIDGLYKLNGNLGNGVKIDLSHIGVTGCSYAGKMALFCGALDERVCLTIAQESGGGGIPAWRYSATEPPGTVEWLPNTDHNWFSEGMFAFGASNNVSLLPEDHHQLLALCAPRALFATDNPDVSWLSNPAAYVSANAALRVYTGFGVADRFGYNIVGGHGHCATTATIDNEMGQFINKFLLGQTNANTIIRDVDPTIVSTVNYARWTQWWGTTNAVLPP